MCGRAKLAASPDDLREAFQIEDAPALPPRYNIAPTQPIAVVRAARRLELLRWGLVADAHSSAPNGGARRPPGGGFNVRLESAARAPMYRTAFRSRRCLVVVDGFYEWRRSGGRKHPFLVRRADGRPFALGGLWQRTHAGDGEIVESCAVLTRAASGAVIALHDRMPVIVPPSAYARWIDPAARDLDAALDAGGVEGGGNLIAIAVSDRVNRVANDDVGCVEPVEPEGDLSGGSTARSRSTPDGEIRYRQ